MSAMDKMWLSLVAILLMVGASVCITIARYKVKGIIMRWVFRIVAFILLFYAVILGFISIV
ncbi:DUF2768 family protein [Marinicrinis sediminis]|uniref:DUF2768 family protein n=1 Tax=Marinicrinis sediminis TaxID=1652465 RepID=A0ABW5RFS7_9BACL